METTTAVLVVAAVLAAVVLAGAVAVLVRLVRTRRELRHAGLPTGPRWVFWGAVLYLALPADLLALRTMRGSSGARAPGASPRRDRGRPADDYAP